ncbi:hypothetical protein V0R37_12070 [Pollutimonas sp. H1-120]
MAESVSAQDGVSGMSPDAGKIQPPNHERKRSRRLLRRWMKGAV